MRQLRSYVVRIYGQGYRTLSGVVEDTRTSAQRAFRDNDELLTLLARPIRRRVPTRRRGSSG